MHLRLAESVSIPIYWTRTSKQISKQAAKKKKNRKQCKPVINTNFMYRIFRACKTLSNFMRIKNINRSFPLCILCINTFVYILVSYRFTSASSYFVLRRSIFFFSFTCHFQPNIFWHLRSIINVEENLHFNYAKESCVQWTNARK